MHMVSLKSAWRRSARPVMSNAHSLSASTHSWSYAIAAVAGMIALGLGAQATAQTVVTLTPTADTYTEQGQPTVNFGTATTVLIRRDPAGTLTRGGYFQFDLSGLPTGTITSAVLRLWGSQDQGGTGITLKSHGGTAATPWDETALTYNNALTLSGVDFSSTSLATITVSPPPAAWYSWDVTSYITSRRTAGHATVGVGYTTTDTYRSTFNSRQATTNRPQLVVTFGGPPPPPPTPPPPVSNWPMFGKDYANSRVSSSQWIGTGDVASLRVINRYQANAVTSTPLVVDNVIYYADKSSRLYARNFSTGALIWSTNVATGQIPGTPFVSADTVYVVGDGSRVHAVNRATGAIRWISPALEPSPNNRVWSSPILVGNRLILGLASYQVWFPGTPMFRGSVVAIDINNNGAILWRRSACPTGTCGGGISIWSSVAVDTELRQVYIGTGQGYATPSGPYSDSVLAINYETGAFAWTRQLTAGDIWTQSSPSRQDHDVGSSPNLFSINGVKVVGVGDKGGRYTVMNRTTGAIVWQRAVGSPGALGGVMGVAAYRNGRIHVVSNRGGASTAYCLDANTGNIIWSTAISFAAFGSVSLAGNVMYFATTNGVLYALDATTGAVLRTVQLGPQADSGAYYSGDHPNGSGSGAMVHRGRVLVGYGFTWNSTTGGGLAVLETNKGIEP